MRKTFERGVELCRNALRHPRGLGHSRVQPALGIVVPDRREGRGPAAPDLGRNPASRTPERALRRARFCRWPRAGLRGSGGAAPVCSVDACADAEVRGALVARVAVGLVLLLCRRPWRSSCAGSWPPIATATEGTTVPLSADRRVAVAEDGASTGSGACRRRSKRELNSAGAQFRS